MSKLVRDKIQELFPENSFHTASSDEEYWAALKEKLREEVEEFLHDENEEEMADILEVLDAICTFKHFRNEDLHLLKIKKAEKRGAFEKRIILDEQKS